MERAEQWPARCNRLITAGSSKFQVVETAACEVFRSLPENLSLHGDAFDLYKKPRPSEFSDTDAGPCTSASGEELILHLPEHRHVAVHIDVISRHFDHVLEVATTGCQNQPQILPRRQKLLLRVFDNG